MKSRIFYFLYPLIVTLLVCSKAASADPTISDLVKFCSAATDQDTAAAYGCELVGDAAKKAELSEIFDDYLEFICSRGADIAQSHNCSKNSDAVSIGYGLECEAVKQRCGCNNSSCTGPGSLTYGGVNVFEAGSSCEHPIEVHAPSILAKLIASSLINLAVSMGAGMSLQSLAQNFADPTTGNLVDIVALEILRKRLQEVPDGDWLVVRFDDKSKSACYIKRNLGGGTWRLESPA